MEGTESSETHYGKVSVGMAPNFLSITQAYNGDIRCAFAQSDEV
jgi:hypothetical protein